MIEIKDICLHYGKSKVLNNINLSFEIGKISSIMGPNGVGKTSLLKILSGAHPSSAGKYLFQNIEVTNMRSDKLAKLGIGYVPQGREIFPLLTVLENLQIGFSCLDKGEEIIPQYIYEMFPVLKKMLSRRGGDLSGGQQQQLAIARALITKPKFLLLDEPTEGIQPNIISLIGDVLRQLKDKGNMGIILVEQYFEFAYELSDNVNVMRKGEVVYSKNKENSDKDEVKKYVRI